MSLHVSRKPYENPGWLWQAKCYVCSFVAEGSKTEVLAEIRGGPCPNRGEQQERHMGTSHPVYVEPRVKRRCRTCGGHFERFVGGSVSLERCELCLHADETGRVGLALELPCWHEPGKWGDAGHLQRAFGFRGREGWACAAPGSSSYDSLSGREDFACTKPAVTHLAAAGEYGLGGSLSCGCYCKKHAAWIVKHVQCTSVPLRAPGQ